MTPKLFHTLSTGPSHFTRFWCEPHRQAAKDFRTQWRRCGLWLLLTAWLAMLTIALVLLSYPTSDSYASLPACLPDESFAMDPSKFQFFSSSGFFQITMGFGNMTFTHMKAIDIVWDILVGRGGQALAAYISWRVFANYVTTSMKVTPVTFRTYRTMFLPDNGLFIAILCMIRDFVTRHGLHSKIAIVFMVFTMIFTFVYPTLASAMTGYSANVAAFVNTTRGEYIPFDALSLAYYVVHDGSRIGLNEDHCLTAPWNNSYFPGSQPVISSLSAIDSDFTGCHWRGKGELFDSYGCKLQRNISKYAQEYGLNGGKMQNSTFGDSHLGPPILNISAPSLEKDSSRSDSPYYSDLAWRVTDNSSLLLWAYDNQIYHLDYLQKNGKCQAALDYKWGFSYIQLFIMIILHIIWTLGLYTMWLRAYMIMKKRGRGKEGVAGEHKAVFELAAAMREQMNESTKEEGDDVAALTEAKLRRRITKDLRGGFISYTTPLLPNGESGEEWNTKAWIKSHKLSILAMVACVATTVFSAAFLPPTTMFLLPLPFELVLALYIGSTRKSRIVLFVWTFFIIIIPTQTTISIATY